MPDVDVSKLPILNDLSGSLADRVYIAVKKAILDMDFPPGASIRKSLICERLGLSRSPVSDALAKLSGEGLVEIIPQSGTRVSRLSMAAIREDAFLREALEVAAIRHAAAHRSDEVMARLNRSIEVQKVVIHDVDGDEFMKADVAFHETIMSTTSVTRLPAAVRAVSPNVDRTRVLMLDHAGRRTETLAEHVAIVDAIERKDVLAAEDAMRQHLRQLLKRLEPLEASHPNLFST